MTSLRRSKMTKNTPTDGFIKQRHFIFLLYLAYLLQTRAWSLAQYVYYPLLMYLITSNLIVSVL